MQHNLPILWTGHVTAGGSICIEALTLSGTAGSWTSQYNVEAILNIIILNMIGETFSSCLPACPSTCQVASAHLH